jgi:hypothetical protein
VLRPPAHRGWCLVQAPRWGASRAGGAVWGPQNGKIWTTDSGPAPALPPPLTTPSGRAGRANCAKQCELPSIPIPSRPAASWALGALGRLIRAATGCWALAGRWALDHAPTTTTTTCTCSLLDLDPHLALAPRTTTTCWLLAAAAGLWTLDSFSFLLPDSWLLDLHLHHLPPTTCHYHLHLLYQKANASARPYDQRPSPRSGQQATTSY